MIRMSSDAIATAAAASHRSCASMKRSSSSRSSALGSPADHSARRAGRCSCIVARARWSALLAAATLVSSRRRRLGRRPAEHVADDQRRALSRRQDLQGGEERELDRLALDDDRVRLLVARRDLVQQPVRVRLQPRHLGEGVQHRHPPGPAPDHVEADVRRDPVQPRTERAPPRTVAAAPRPQERLLHGVLRLVERGEHPVAVDVQLAPVALGELGEGGLVLGDRAGHAAGFPLPDLLEDPAVAVGVAEVGERAVVGVLGIRARRPAARRHVADLADLDAACRSSSARAASMSVTMRCMPR